MKIKGEFRDVLIKNGKVIEERGWISNSIAPDYGQFLAAVMKKEFKDNSAKPVGIGIEYLAVGSSSGSSADNFKGRVSQFFSHLNNNGDADRPYPNPSNPDPENWVWAKKIDDAKDIMYLTSDEPGESVATEITDYLQIKVTFKKKDSTLKSEPDTVNNLNFEDFALVGIYNSGTEDSPVFDTNRMFFVNYRTHDTITKEPSAELTRTIRLKFPLT